MFATIFFLISNDTPIFLYISEFVAILAAQYCHPFLAYTFLLVGVNKNQQNYCQFGYHKRLTFLMTLNFLPILLQPLENKLLVHNQNVAWISYM